MKGTATSWTRLAATLIAALDGTDRPEVRATTARELAGTLPMMMRAGQSRPGSPPTTADERPPNGHQALIMERVEREIWSVLLLERPRPTGSRVPRVPDSGNMQVRGLT